MQLKKDGTPSQLETEVTQALRWQKRKFKSAAAKTLKSVQAGTVCVQLCPAAEADGFEWNVAPSTLTKTQSWKRNSPEIQQIQQKMAVFTYQAAQEASTLRTPVAFASHIQEYLQKKGRSRKPSKMAARSKSCFDLI